MMIIAAPIQQPMRGRAMVLPIPVGRAIRSASARGLYRIFNTAGYRFYRSNVAPPLASDTPFATHATLPYQPTSTYADGTWYVSVSYFDGVLDSGFLPVGPHGETYKVLTIASGVQLPTPPGTPYGTTLKQLAGGIVQIIGYYAATPDGPNRATQWAIAYTVDGSTPASGSPTITPSMGNSAGNMGARAVLTYRLPAQSNGTTVKVLLQVRRPISGGYSYSPAAPVLSTVVNTSGPSAPLGGA